MKILIAGSSGFLGQALKKFLTNEKEIEVYSLTRYPQQTSPNCFFTDFHKQLEIPLHLHFDAVVNLCGANLAQSRWTSKRKEILVTSRIQPVSAIKKWIDQKRIKTNVFFSASGIGFYPFSEEKVFNENSTSGNSFLSQLCQEWEKPLIENTNPDIRCIIMRLGVVLDLSGGLLAKIRFPFSLGLGGNLGNGKQFFSWISLEDFLRAFEFLLKTQELNDVVNFCSPTSCRNQLLTKKFAEFLKRPAFFPAPNFLLKSIFGKQFAEELLLSSQKVVPQKLLDNHFSFKHPNLESLFSYAQFNL